MTLMMFVRGAVWVRWADSGGTGWMGVFDRSTGGKTGECVCVT